MRISDWSSDVCSSDLLSNLLGKGFILPAPILPRARFRSLALPTPMSTCQQNLPIAPYAYAPEGREIGGRPLGKLPRNHATPVDSDELLAAACHERGHDGKSDGSGNSVKCGVYIDGRYTRK